MSKVMPALIERGGRPGGRAPDQRRRASRARNAVTEAPANVADPLAVEVEVVSAHPSAARFESHELTSLATSVLAAEGAAGAWSVTVALVDDEALRQLHERFMGEGTVTDVMTFPHQTEPLSPRAARRRHRDLAGSGRGTGGQSTVSRLSQKRAFSSSTLAPSRGGGRTILRTSANRCCGGKSSYSGPTTNGAATKAEGASRATAKRQGTLVARGKGTAKEVAARQRGAAIEIVEGGTIRLSLVGPNPAPDCHGGFAGPDALLIHGGGHGEPDADV